MEIILTSFGLSHRNTSPWEDTNLFYRMPPVSMNKLGQGFALDVSVLLLCGKIIMDQVSFDRLQLDPHPLYSNVAELIKALYDEGFVRLEDFGVIVNDNTEFLESMLKRDLRRLNDWVLPLKKSLNHWQEFAEISRNFSVTFRNLDDSLLSEAEMDEVRSSTVYLHHLNSRAALAMARRDLLENALESSSKRRKPEFRQKLKEQVAEYLAYVNTNLVLANVLGAGFHDWHDLSPFYREKFITVGMRTMPEEAQISKLTELFSISFPEFQTWDVKNVIKALKDSRIRDLRVLVEEAVEGKVNFDKEFARRVLFEVLGVEQRLTRIRNISSYVTIPLSFLPWVGTPLEKGVDEVVGRFAEHRLKKDYRWFYLISELSTAGSNIRED